MDSQNRREVDISPDYAVQMHGICKSFSSFHALTDMNLDVKKGTIHSLLGENGAGKSTLMNVLYGLYSPDAGEIYLSGKKTDITNPNVAIKNGIGMVHQHFMLVDTFTVAQNIILGKEPVKKGFLLDMKAAKEQVRQISEKYGLEVDPGALISDISVGMQQRVEILKVLYRGAEILILDEPTAVLTPQEIDELMIIMQKLASDGKTIIIITHKLKEIERVSDTCTIIRSGCYIDSVSVKTCTEDELAAKMVGHPVKFVTDKTPARSGKIVLDIKNLSVKDSDGIEQLRNLDLQVREGEIVGIAGIDGNGQKELVEALDNLCRVDSGTISINGKNIENTDPESGRKCGMSIVPDDRHKNGLIMMFTCEENAILEKYRSSDYLKGPVIRRGKMHEFMQQLVEEYDIRPKDCAERKVSGLSGGNQQKIIIGREIANNPKLLVVVQPTRGLDVGAIETVHSILVKERDKKTAVLLISYELSEIMNLSDRIAVIYNGHIDTIMDRSEATQERIGLLMGGGCKESI